MPGFSANLAYACSTAWRKRFALLSAGWLEAGMLQQVGVVDEEVAPGGGALNGTGH